MLYLLKLHPEITIKSRSVRQQMTRCLTANIRNTLRRLDDRVRVKDQWDAIRVRLPEGLDDDTTAAIEDSLTRIPGIQQVLATEEVRFESLEQAAEHIVPLWSPVIAGHSFRVQAKRRGEHDFTSADMERYLGGRLLEATPNARVDLKHPEVVVPVELNDRRLQVIRARWKGLGGYPLGVQGQALALMSGGFDSPVAAWKMIRRGVKTHFLFFNLGGPAHEAGVREVSHHLWERYGVSHKVKFISVPFDGVVGEILRTIPDGLMGVVLKRLMIRAANRMAQRLRIPALVTGEAIAQVSSQTLANLAVIDDVSERPILRPVLTDDKQDIIDRARQIDTARIAESMPEYCGVISRRPHNKAPLDDVLAAERDFDDRVLDNAIEAAVIKRIDDVLEREPAPAEVSMVQTPEELTSLDTPCIIDIRRADEREAAPLALPDAAAQVPLIEIPFYELQDRAAELDTDRHYLLYCDQGVMSRMQALHLADRGLHHFGVYQHRPDA
ncbi:tRNA uracil 4-sulfurtransferase ThiI [Halomonas salina]|uniref:Probable tRNA sulfurtransferase n=1 Tax=Halomonas salina TaxID=42565 RepID=A0ABR4WRH0_9GAMM|nr:tRNA uracil 4-sulfurtransferase ThiI [Halomonas salina]KGE77306.1 tRNA s(4)U8 sulfurtransferase [Halomonas salina]